MNNEVVKFLWDIRYVIATLLYVILYAIMDWHSAKSKLYALMLQAKGLAKDAVLNSGEEQEDWVVKAAYTLLPKRITAFIPEATMHKIVNWLYIKGKEYLESGKLSL